MASGLKKIKKELGPDALILSTKTIRHGKLGLLSKPMLEITAAVDNEFTESQQPEKSAASFGVNREEKNGFQFSAAGKQPSFQHVVSDPVEQYLGTPAEPVKLTDTAPERESVQLFEPIQQECFREYPSTNFEAEVVRQQAIHEEPQVVENSQTGNGAIESEVNELKQLVRELAGQISELSSKPEKPATQLPDIKPSTIKIPNKQYISKVTAGQLQGDFILSQLIEKGINIESARAITGFLRESLTDQELCNADIVQNAIIGILQSLIEVSPPDFSDFPEQRRIALVGPTGVGKTTTLAKIAASYIQQHSRSIALITIDTYRIAAVEQLKVYGEIMHLPVEVVITPDQLHHAFAKHQDKDLILIDTAGRSPRDTISIEELLTFLRDAHNIEKHLVLSATTRENEIVETINQFDKLGITNTIFTKIDECTSLGVLLNAQVQNTNPISYVTNGQRVPEDLLQISPQIIAELIMSYDEGSMHE